MQRRIQWFRRGGLALGIALAAVAALGISEGTPGARVNAAGRVARAVLKDVNGHSVGSVLFTQQGGQVLVVATVHDLPAEFHGFHVHAVGQCDPTGATPFGSAGGHFNPGGQTHGHHAGDMPSLLIKTDGDGAIAFTTDRFTVAGLLDADGSAVIVHALPDNFANIPTRYAPAGPDATTLATGDSGGRIACGVVAPIG